MWYPFYSLTIFSVIFYLSYIFQNSSTHSNICTEGIHNIKAASSRQVLQQDGMFEQTTAHYKQISDIYS